MKASYQGNGKLKDTTTSIDNSNWEKRYSALFESLSFGVFYQKADGSMLDVNPAALKMFGLTREEFLNRTSYNREWKVIKEDGTFLKPEEYPSIVALKTGKPVKDKNLGIYNPLNEKYTWLNITAIPEFPDNRRNPSQVMVTLHDITRSKQAEEALQVSEYDLKEAQKLAHIGSWKYDLESQKTEWSDQTYELYDRNPALGPPTPDEEVEYYHHEQVQAIHKYANRAIEEGIDLEYDLVAHLPTGRKVYFAAKMHPVKSSNGNIIKLFGTVQNITEQKLIEEKLIESENLLRTVLNNAPITIFATDRNGIFTLSEGKQLELVRLKPGENVGLSAFDLFGELAFFEHSGKVITGRDVIRHVLAGHTVEAFSSLNGIYFDNHIVPIRDKDGKVDGIIGVATDVTERKKVEDELAKSEEHYRTLFNSIDEGFCIVEVIFDENEKPVDYRFLETNPSFEKQTDLIDAKGKSMRELAPKHEEDWFNIYGRIALTGKPERFVKKAEQLHRWYDVYAFRLDKPENRHVAILFSDITDRKQTNDALSLNQEKLDLALKSAEMGVWHYDINQNARIFNGHTCRLLDIDETTFNGTENEFYKVVHPNDRVKIRKALRKSITNKAPYSVEYRVMRKDGTISYISARGKLISGTDGKTEGIIGIVWNSTERKLFEEKLKKSEADLKQYSEELRALYQHIDEVLEQERNQIARDLHDDLGQKLTALNLNISWIKSRMGVQSHSVNNKLVDMANLLNIAAESLNKISYRLRPAILDDLGIQAAIEWQLSDLRKSTGISFSVSFIPEKFLVAPDLSLTIFRIVQESLTNVVRHAKATSVSIYFSMSNTDLRLLIKDNGIGIEQDKVANSKSFGLIGMRERVGSYGGEIVIKGRPNKGTVIRIKLPITR